MHKARSGSCHSVPSGTPLEQHWPRSFQTVASALSASGHKWIFNDVRLSLNGCPLYPQKRTCASQKAMSALPLMATGKVTSSAPLIRKTCDARCQIDHWLLTVRYEPGAPPIRIHDQIDDGGDECSHDINGYARTFCIDPACIARECAGDGCDGKQRKEHSIGNSVAQCRQSFSLIGAQLRATLYE